jgi:hypothetical protein
VRIDVSEEKHLAMEAVRFYKTTVTLTHKASTTAGSCVCKFKKSILNLSAMPYTVKYCKSEVGLAFFQALLDFRKNVGF